MALKIEPASVEELESEFGSSTSGNDPETVQYIRGLAIGQGFNVTAEGGETERQIKRRINACAKEAFRELDWRNRPSGGLAARVKAIDVDAEKKAQEEAEAARKKAEEEAAQKAAQEAQEQARAQGEGSGPDNPPNGSQEAPGAPPNGSRKREPATA